MERAVYVTGIGSVSAIAASSRVARAAYATSRSFATERRIADREHRVYAAAHEAEAAVFDLCQRSPRDAALDRSAHLAILAAREAIEAAGWRERRLSAAVLIASSRGPTATLEARHAEYLDAGRARTLTSPTTTLGGLASRVAHELAQPSLAEGVSATCSGSLQSLLLGVAWLSAGLGDACLVGGCEAPLTAFTLAQFGALGLIGRAARRDPPSRPLSVDPSDELGIGEGACLLALERLTHSEAERRGALAEITGLGACVERAHSLTGITPGGDALARAMSRALAQHRGRVEAVVVHAPGTRRGDSAELAALDKVFGRELPALCSAKWQTGHTFGAAGALAVDFGVALLTGVRPAEPPYASGLRAPERAAESVMVNAAGFGGAAASVVLRRLR